MFDFLNKKYKDLKNLDPQVRLKAIENLSPEDWEWLHKTAETDSSPEVRMAAINKIDNCDELEKLRQLESSPELNKLIRRKLNERYAGMVQTTDDKTIIDSLLEKIDDENLLATIACMDLPPLTLECATERIKDPEQILKVLRNLTNEMVARELLQKLDDVNLLEDLAASAKSTSIRNGANEKLRRISPEKFAVEVKEENLPQLDQLEDELKYNLFERENICKNIENATGRCDSETIKTFKQWQQEWEKLGKLPEKYYELTERYQDLCTKFTAGIKLAEERVAERIEKLKKIDNLVRQLEIIAAGTIADINHADLTKINQTWVELTSDIKDIELTQSKYDAANNKITAKIEEFKQQQKNAILLLAEACVKLQNFIGDINPESCKAERSELDKQVREACAILPDGYPDKNKLYSEYHQLNKQFSSILHERYVVRDLDRCANYAMKLEICRQLEAIKDNSNIHEIAHKLKESREHWKKIGPVPTDKFEEINQQFKQLNDIMQQQCNVFYEKLNQEKEETAKLKLSLCEESEALCMSRDWNETTEKIKVLQSNWKSLPICHSNTEQELYRRFQQACDTFFSARKAYYEEAHSRFDQHAKAKQALCDEADKTFVQPIQGDPRKKVKIFWDRWKEIGHSGKEEGALYQRFRGIFDKFYDTMREHLNENLANAKSLCSELEKLQDELVNHKTPLSEIRQKCREISDKWQTVGELPHDENHNLEEIFWKLHDTLKSAFLTEQKRQYSQLLSELESREDIIARAVIDGTNLEQLQSEWQQIGETAEDIKYLDPLLKQIVQTAESDDKTCLTRLTEQMTKNLKARKKLCREIEELAGIEGENVEPEAVMSLADELAMAISNNFATPSGKSSPPVDKNSKLKSIQKQWISSAPVPAEELSALSSRFSRAWEVASTQCTNS